MTTDRERLELIHELIHTPDTHTSRVIRDRAAKVIEELMREIEALRTALKKLHENATAYSIPWPGDGKP